MMPPVAPRFLDFPAAYILLAAIFIASNAVQAQSPTPLPDRDSFIAQVRSHLQTDEELQSQYTYLEKRQGIRIGKLGSVRAGDVRLFEVYPSREPGETYRRLIAVNGVPLDPATLRKRDEARQKYVADRAAIEAGEAPAQRAERERRKAEVRRRQQEMIDDVFTVYDIVLTDRDVVDGHHAIVAMLTPRPGARTKSEAGKYFSAFRGRAWVSEDDFQVMKVEMQALKDVLIGWGFAGRIDRGSTMTFERRKINDEVWLPARVSVTLAGRALLVRKFRVEAVTEFSDYKKFSVLTRETYQTTPQ